MCKCFAEKCSGGMIWTVENPRDENGRLHSGLSPEIHFKSLSKRQKWRELIFGNIWNYPLTLPRSHTCLRWVWLCKDPMGHYIQHLENVQPIGDHDFPSFLACPWQYSLHITSLRIFKRTKINLTSKGDYEKYQLEKEQAWNSKEYGI